MKAHRLQAALITCLLIGSLAPSRAEVFYARDEALDIAFPDADRTEVRDFFLTDRQRLEIERQAKAPLDSSLLTVYVGYRDDKPLGYAVIDTHVVRTLPETFLVVLSPEGTVAGTYVLAFYEPLEYLPSKRWIEQFHGRRLGDDLQVGRSVAAITGSTLTSHAVTKGIRRALAIYRVLLEED